MLSAARACGVAAPRSSSITFAVAAWNRAGSVITQVRGCRVSVVSNGVAEIVGPTTPATERGTVAAYKIHRAHAIIENTHADLKASALACPPGSSTPTQSGSSAR